MNEEPNASTGREDELREEYDLDELLGGARIGAHAERYALGTNLVRLDPDVASAFQQDSETVNAALRLVLEAARLARTERGA